MELAANKQSMLMSLAFERASITSWRGVQSGVRLAAMGQAN